MSRFQCCWMLWLLRSTYPWLHLPLRSWQAIAAPPSQRSRRWARVWVTVYHIDFAALLAFGMEMVQPEFWL